MIHQLRIHEILTIGDNRRPDEVSVRARVYQARC